VIDVHVLRLRCPRGLGDPSIPYAHYAVDLRLPLDAVAASELIQAAGDCCCGARMIILTSDVEDRRNGDDAP